MKPAAARKSTPEQAKKPFRSKVVALERAPPPSLRLARDDEDACSDADSVVSDYRLDDVHDSTDASTGTMGATSSEQSPTARSRHELPSLSKRSTNSESPVGASSTRSASRDEELQVSASTAGEWVTRLAGLKELAEGHQAATGRIWKGFLEMFPEAKPSKEETVRFQEDIYEQLEMSRALLEQHAQGLVGSDLAELSLLKSQTKRCTERLQKMDKLYHKEYENLRKAVERSALEPAVDPPKEDYEPLMFLEPEERGWFLTELERQLEELFASCPMLMDVVNQKEYRRLQDRFKKEQLSQLEREVAKCMQRLEDDRKQLAALEEHNQNLKLKLEARRSSSVSVSSSRVHGISSSPRLEPREAEHEAARPPEGKPKAGRPMGRPKRGATYSRAKADESQSAPGEPP